MSKTPSPRGKTRLKKPVGWPRYMKVRKLAKNRAAYYWVPTERDRARGFSYGPEALGEDYGAALERANALNRFLDA